MLIYLLPRFTIDTDDNQACSESTGTERIFEFPLKNTNALLTKCEGLSGDIIPREYGLCKDKNINVQPRATTLKYGSRKRR